MFIPFSSNGPALRRTCHAIEVSSLRKTRAVLAASAAAALQLHFVHFLSFSGFALCRAPLPRHCRDRRLRRRHHPVSVAAAAAAAAADKLTTSVQVVKEHKKVNVDNVSS